MAGFICTAMAGGGAWAQQVFTLDVIVRADLCVGTECSNFESFGTDGLRLKQDVLRLHFNDTSTAADYPSNDWRLIANEAGELGRNMFAIEDSTAGRTPFVVEAGAPVSSLYLQSDGDLGLGTSDPQAKVHMLSGDAPRLRWEQDGSAGFAPQVWDVVGSDAYFAVQNATARMTDPLAPVDVPFQIYPDGGTANLVLRAGRAGVGTDDPQTALHVVSTEGLGKILMQDTGGSGPLRMLDLQNDGAVQLWMNNTTRSDASWLFSAGRSLFLSPTDNALDRVFELSNTRSASAWSRIACGSTRAKSASCPGR
ncbi:hypothetical protein N9W17_04095 [Jannaschia sp.]|nr:hypothetical protein [Jannaschia sp.]